MQVYIDQSGKVADTQIITILAFSNSITYSILISTIVKRKIVKILSKLQNKKQLYIKLFSILIFLLIKKYYKKLNSIIIDKEYWGKENEIKIHLINLFKLSKIFIKPEIIHFTQIGKKSNAHNVAITAFRKKQANETIHLNQILP